MKLIHIIILKIEPHKILKFEVKLNVNAAFFS
jgi:hypothetical protein